MRVKSRKPPAEYLITSLRVTSSRSRGGADDRIGDQVRQVAGDREHADRGARRPSISTSAPSALPERGDARRPRAGSAPAGGVRMHQRLWNSVAKPASGPLCSVPATGCAGMTVAPGSASRSASATLALDEPTSLTIASAGRSAAIAARRRAHRADRHAEDDQIGIGHRRAGGVGDIVAQARRSAARRAHRRDRRRSRSVAHARHVLPAPRARSTSRSGPAR